MTGLRGKVVGGACAWVAAWSVVAWLKYTRLVAASTGAEAMVVVMVLLGLAAAGGVLVAVAVPRLALFWEALGVSVVVCLPVAFSGALAALPGLGPQWQREEPGRYLVGLVGVTTIWIFFALLGRSQAARREGAAIQAVRGSLSFQRHPEHEQPQHWLSESEKLSAEMLGRRLKLLVDSHANPSWPDLMAERANLDASELQIAYGPLRALVWALPALGFIGTAAAMAGAIGGMAPALTGGVGNQAQVALLTRAIPHLADAFSITLVALSASVISYFVMALAYQREEQVLNDANALMLVVVNRLQRDSRDAAGDPTDRLFAELWSLEQVVTSLSGTLQRVLEGGGYAGTLSNLLTALYTELRAFNDMAGYWCDLRDEEEARGPAGTINSPAVLLREILQELKKMQGGPEASAAHSESHTVGVAR